MKALAELGPSERLALLDRPNAYARFTDDDLDKFTFWAIGVYGMTGHVDLIPKLQGVYGLFQQRIPREQRLQNYLATQYLVEGHQASLNALLPYLFQDSDPGIVSTVAIDYAVLHPLKNGDPLTGPKDLLGHIPAGNLHNSAAALGGLLLLGDQRVMELIRPLRNQLDWNQAETVTKCWNRFITAALVEFYVSWLEELTGEYDGPVFGLVAGALARLVNEAEEPVVRSIERVFPSTPENAIRVLRSWSLKEYAAMLMTRLKAIAMWEKDPKVMPDVLRIWSLEKGTSPTEAVPPIRFPCSHCGKILKAPAEKSGHTSRCPYCRMGVVVPYM